MSDFLSRLIDRTHARIPVLQPRRSSMFEPARRQVHSEPSRIDEGALSEGVDGELEISLEREVSDPLKAATFRRNVIADSGIAEISEPRDSRERARESTTRRPELANEPRHVVQGLTTKGAILGETAPRRAIEGKRPVAGARTDEAAETTNRENAEEPRPVVQGLTTMERSLLSETAPHRAIEAKRPVAGARTDEAIETPSVENLPKRFPVPPTVSAEVHSSQSIPTVAPPTFASPHRSRESGIESVEAFVTESVRAPLPQINVVPGPQAEVLPVDKPFTGILTPVRSTFPQLPVASHQGGPVVSHDDAPSAEPTVHVTIGRIEVRANQPPPPTRSTRSALPRLSLEEYLSAQSGGRR